MGCAFSSKRVQRVFKRKRVSRAHKYIISTPAKVENSWTCDLNGPRPSEKPATPNSYTAEWYAPDVAPSLLAWLIGAKDCLEDSIPELADTNKQESKKSDVVLPSCLHYEGYHEHGYHLFTLNSSLLNNTVKDMSLEFGEQLLRIVLYQPSWYIKVILEEKPVNTCLGLSEAVIKKLKVTCDFKELAKLTGFPGEIPGKNSTH